MPKATVRDLLQGKGKRQFTEIHVRSPDDAAAAEAAGIDMIVASFLPGSAAIRAAAPQTHITYALQKGRYAGAVEALRGAYAAIEEGADSIYTSMSFEVVEALARERVPVVGHVGLIPHHQTWMGGFRAVGKNADEALRLYEDVKRYEAAGAFAVEIEVVPHKVATEIARRTTMLVISMGSGNGCDVQYLFSDDILGETTGRIPRHAKVYRDFKTEYRRLQEERIAAFRDYANDVRTSAFPAPANLVDIDDAQFSAFLDGLR